MKKILKFMPVTALAKQGIMRFARLNGLTAEGLDRTLRGCLA